MYFQSLWINGEPQNKTFQFCPLAANCNHLLAQIIFPQPNGGDQLAVPTLMTKTFLSPPEKKKSERFWRDQSGFRSKSVSPHHPFPLVTSHPPSHTALLNMILPNSVVAWEFPQLINLKEGKRMEKKTIVSHPPLPYVCVVLFRFFACKNSGVSQNFSYRLKKTFKGESKLNFVF